MKKIVITIGLFLSLAWSAGAQQILSPDGNLKLNVSVNEKGVPTYSLDYKGGKVIEASRLGLSAQEAELIDNFKVVDSQTSTFNETWTPVWGEYDKVLNHYNELAVSFQQQDGNKRAMIVRFRLYDDGLGFRYELPVQETMNYLTLKDVSILSAFA